MRLRRRKLTAPEPLLDEREARNEDVRLSNRRLRKVMAERDEYQQHLHGSALRMIALQAERVNAEHELRESERARNVAEEQLHHLQAIGELAELRERCEGLQCALHDKGREVTRLVRVFAGVDALQVLEPGALLVLHVDEVTDELMDVARALKSELGRPVVAVTNGQWAESLDDDQLHQLGLARLTGAMRALREAIEIALDQRRGGES